MQFNVYKEELGNKVCYVKKDTNLNPTYLDWANWETGGEKFYGNFFELQYVMFILGAVVLRIMVLVGRGFVAFVFNRIKQCCLFVSLKLR